MKSLKVLSVAALIALVAACCPCRKGSSYYDQFNKLQGTEWKLVQKDDKAFAAAGQSYTIAFLPDRMLTGMGDCNRFSGVMSLTVTKNTQKFSIGQISSTRIACMDLAGENDFFEFLRKADSVQIDGDLMMMQSVDSSGKHRRFVFERTSKK